MTSIDMKHKAICFDDEGRLNCCCTLGAINDVATEEQISKAEAQRLVEAHAFESMRAVLNLMDKD